MGYGVLAKIETYIRMRLQVSYHNREDDESNDVVKTGPLESRKGVALYSLW